MYCLHVVSVPLWSVVADLASVCTSLRDTCTQFMPSQSSLIMGVGDPLFKVEKRESNMWDAGLCIPAHICAQAILNPNKLFVFYKSNKICQITKCLNGGI